MNVLFIGFKFYINTEASQITTDSLAMQAGLQAALEYHRLRPSKVFSKRHVGHLTNIKSVPSTCRCRSNTNRNCEQKYLTCKIIRAAFAIHCALHTTEGHFYFPMQKYPFQHQPFLLQSAVVKRFLARGWQSRVRVNTFR